VEKSIKKIEEHALAELKSVFAGKGKANREIVEALYTRFLGRKGEITRLLREISSLSPEQRPIAGQKINELKKKIDGDFKKALGKIDAMAEGEEEALDVSLPGRAPEAGSLHPVSRISARICDIFRRLGFDIAEGPEVENDYYNFEALNFPANHPARDMQDTFFVSDNVVLRTHTSPLQVRVMEKQPPPVQVIAPGKVYRCDSDLTHTPMFHQVEGLLVGENVSFGDLKGILASFIHQMFDERTSLRFRPSFFPFTEPSAEVDILCVICRGKGCRVCSRTGWLEVLGSGMVHPAVFEHVGYDASKYTGFAFGMGVERMAMLKYGIDDIRKFFDNDSRFLRQF